VFWASVGTGPKYTANRLLRSSSPLPLFQTNESSTVSYRFQGAIRHRQGGVSVTCHRTARSPGRAAMWGQRPEEARGPAGRQRSIKKGLTNVCLYEIIGAGFDSELARAVRNAECGMRSAECGVRNAECGMQSAECRMRSAECRQARMRAGQRHMQMGTRLASSLPYYTSNLLVTGRQGSMFMRISVLQGNKHQGRTFPWPATADKQRTCTPPVM